VKNTMKFQIAQKKSRNQFVLSKQSNSQTNMENSQIQQKS
jgi:hypothetical protein